MVYWLKRAGVFLLIFGFWLIAKFFKSTNLMMSLLGVSVALFGLIAVFIRVPLGGPTGLFKVDGPLLDVTKVAIIFMSFPLAPFALLEFVRGDMFQAWMALAFFAGPLFLIYLFVFSSRLGKWIGWRISQWNITVWYGD